MGLLKFWPIETDRVLGCHIIAHEAGTLIHEVATAMAFGIFRGYR